MATLDDFWQCREGKRLRGMDCRMEERYGKRWWTHPDVRARVDRIYDKLLDRNSNPELDGL